MNYNINFFSWFARSIDENCMKIRLVVIEIITDRRGRGLCILICGDLVMYYLTQDATFLTCKWVNLLAFLFVHYRPCFNYHFSVLLVGISERCRQNPMFGSLPKCILCGYTYNGQNNYVCMRSIGSILTENACTELHLHVKHASGYSDVGKRGRPGKKVARWPQRSKRALRKI